MRLILIRHGETPSNVDGVLDTLIPGPGLTPLGVEQAQTLVRTLAREPIESIHASSMIRTQLTAAPLAAHLGLEVQVRDGLREVDAGELEGRTDRDSVIAYVTTFLHWVRGDLDHRMPGAETGHMVLERFDRVVAEIEGLGVGTAAIVAHGAVIRAWVGCRTDDLDADFLEGHYVENTGFVVLAGSAAGGWKLETWQGGGMFDAETRFSVSQNDPVETTLED